MVADNQVALQCDTQRQSWTQAPPPHTHTQRRKIETGESNRLQPRDRSSHFSGRTRLCLASARFHIHTRTQTTLTHAHTNYTCRTYTKERLRHTQKYTPQSNSASRRRTTETRAHILRITLEGASLKTGVIISDFTRRFRRTSRHNQQHRFHGTGQSQYTLRLALQNWTYIVTVLPPSFPERSINRTPTGLHIHFRSLAFWGFHIDDDINFF